MLEQDMMLSSGGLVVLCNNYNIVILFYVTNANTIMAVVFVE